MDPWLGERLNALTPSETTPVLTVIVSAASRVALLFHHCVANPDATTASLYCPAPRSGTTKLPSERVTANATIEPFVAFNTSTRPPATGVSPSPGVVTVP